MLVDSRDEELTLENVDEQVARELAQLQTSQPLTMTSLTRTVRNLQLIYEEQRRLERVWERLNDRVSALDPATLHSTASPEQDEDDTTVVIQPLTLPGKATQDGNGLLAPYPQKPQYPQIDRGDEENLASRKLQAGKQPRRPRRWRNLGYGLIAALVLLTICAIIFARPLLSFHPDGSQTGSHPTPVTTVLPLPKLTPRAEPTMTPTVPPTSAATPRPTASASALKEYDSQYFKIQYPAGWVITNVTLGGTSRQTVQFRPSAASPVFVTVDAMYPNDLTSSQLLNIDPDLTLGTLVSTSTVTYHGVPWAVGIINLGGSLLSQPSTLEVAYSNQHTPYKLEFSAPAGMFASYSSIFHTMFASFYAGQ